MLYLRDFENADAETILGWISDEKVFRQWSADKYKDYPAKPEDIIGFYEEIKTNGARPFILCDGDESVGHFILRPLPDEEIKTVRMGFIIVDSKIRGKGYGKKMLEIALNYAFDTFACKRVTLGVFENNPKAKKCYESVGFKNRDEMFYNINDENWKCIEMEYIREL